ncbi:MAG: cysteine desulfurase family protein [Tagaea sp.]
MTVYLDWNASAPIRREAVDAFARACVGMGNPSSVHAAGRAARAAVEKARAQVGALVGVAAECVIFTGCGTEANALAVNGFDADAAISAVEHDAIAANLPAARRLAVTREGAVDLEAIDLAGAKLVAVMLANNETGVIQPVAEVAARAKAQGARVHCDAVQAAGKIPVDFHALGVDTLALSAHKLGGPMGVGALIVRDGVDVKPLWRGGGQEKGARAGTPNLPGIVAFGVAVELAAQELGGWAKLAAARDHVANAVDSAALGTIFYGARAPRLPNTLCLGLPGAPAHTQVMALDLAGFAVSAGAACSSGKIAPSTSLLAMGAGEGAGETIRVSFGPATDEKDLAAFAAAYVEFATRRKRARAA